MQTNNIPHMHLPDLGRASLRSVAPTPNHVNNKSIIQAEKDRFINYAYIYVYIDQDIEDIHR